MAMASALGMRMKGDQSFPPVSSSRTEAVPSSERRLASTQPAEPAPTIT